MYYNFWSTLFLHEISRCLFLYNVHIHVFRISVTGMPFSFFFITFCSRCCMEWDTACRPTDDPFWAFLSPGAQEPVQPPNNVCLVLGIHPKDNHPGPFQGKAFVLLYQLETSWALLGRRSRGFFLPSQGSLNIRFSRNCWNVRASSSSSLF